MRWLALPAEAFLVVHLAIDQQGRCTVEETVAVSGRAEGDTTKTAAPW